MAAARLGSVTVPRLRAIARDVPRIARVSTAAASHRFAPNAHASFARQAANRWLDSTGFGWRRRRISGTRFYILRICAMRGAAAVCPEVP